jgi:hypothetical protein
VKRVLVLIELVSSLPFAFSIDVFGILKVVKDGPPLIVCPTFKELTEMEGVRIKSATRELVEIMAVFKDEVYTVAELMTPAGPVHMTSLFTVRVDAFRLFTCKLFVIRVFEITREFVFTLLIIREPAGLLIRAEPMVKLVMVGAEIVLAT